MRKTHVAIIFLLTLLIPYALAEDNSTDLFNCDKIPSYTEASPFYPDLPRVLAVDGKEAEKAQWITEHPLVDYVYGDCRSTTKIGYFQDRNEMPHLGKYLRLQQFYTCEVLTTDDPTIMAARLKITSIQEYTNPKSEDVEPQEYTKITESYFGNKCTYNGGAIEMQFCTANPNAPMPIKSCQELQGEGSKCEEIWIPADVGDNYIIGTYKVAYCTKPAPPEPDCTDSDECVHIKGAIQDGNGLPVPDLQIDLRLDDGTKKTAYTDVEGKYDFGLMKNKDPFEHASLTMRLMFTFKDEGGNFQIHDADANQSPTNKEADVNQPIQVATEYYPIKDHKEVIDFKNDLDLFVTFDLNAFTRRTLQKAARTQFYMSKATRFALEEMGVDIGANGPVKVFLSSTGTHYNRNTHEIHIGFLSSDWDDASKPDNVEWHEFSHALMKVSAIGGTNDYPDVPIDEIRRNHLGFANPSTTDSWSEGFAIFLSSALSIEADYLNPGDKPWIYIVADTQRYNLEDNIKAWDNLGRSEDMSVGALLWDLYDSDKMYADDDKVHLSFDELWRALNRETNLDIKDVYDSLVLLYPSVDFDEVFISHGFFVDDNGDYFWQEGEEVGRAASPKVGLMTRFDLDRDGKIKIWDLNTKSDKYIVGDENGVDAFWGSISDNHLMTDMDGDGLNELDEDGFYVFPYSERRNKPVYEDNIVHIDLLDEDGKKVDDIEMTFKLEYPDSSRDYEYTANVSREVPIYVFSDATLTISHGKEKITITGEEFEENTVLGSQGSYEITLPAAASDTGEDKKSNWWVYILIAVILIVAIYLLKRKSD